MTPKTKRADWRFSATDIAKRDGFIWIKSKINRYDHQKLDSVIVSVDYPSKNKAQTREEYREWFKAHGLQPVFSNLTSPPPRSRKIGYIIEARVFPWDIPWPVPVSLPPLYRRPGGVWEPAPDATDYAVTWDNDVLDAFWAICAAETDERIANDWAKEHKKTGAMFGPLVKIARRDFNTEYAMVRGTALINSVDDAIVFGVAREAFTWLRNTKQIPGRKSKHARDQFAIKMLTAFRKAMSAERRRKAKSGAGFPSSKTKQTFPGFPGQ